MYSKPTVNTHTQNLCQALNRELFPSLSSFALLSPSVPGLRQGKEPGRAASWNKSICRSRPGPAATEGLRRGVRELSSSVQMQMTSPFLTHNNTPFVAEGQNPSFVQSTLIYGTHILDAHTVARTTKANTFKEAARKSWKGGFSVWEMVWIIYLNMPFTASPQHWFLELQRPHWLHFHLV